MTLEADATAGQEQTAAADTTKTATTAAETTTAATTEGAAKAAEVTTQADKTATTETAVAATWPDDWRERLAGEDAKELARLRRFSSFDNYLKRTNDLENRLRSGMLKPTLAEGATEAEVAEYRKANGIPEKADADAYGLKFPQGYEPNDADKSDVSEFLAAAHKANIPPAHVQLLWGQYLGIKEKADQQLYEAAQQTTINYKAEIKAEYGRDYDKNTRLGNAHLVQTVGEDQAKEFMAMTLADGTKLGDNPKFVRYIVAQALANADDSALVTSEFEGGGKSIDEQIKAALELKFTDNKAYHSPEHQAKMDKLYAAKAAKKAA